MCRSLLLVCSLAVALAFALHAQSAEVLLNGQKLPAPHPLALLSLETPDALAGNLRGYLVRSLPPTLYEGSHNWGHTARTTRGLRWKGQGFGVHPELIKLDKNDGTWRHARVTADNLSDTLIVDLRDIRQSGPGRLTFTLFLSFDARGEYTEQHWNAGLKLYDSSLRVRLRIKLTLPCEATVRLETSGELLPDAVFRLRATGADLHYDNVVVEHVAGIGGEAAKLFGDAVRGGLRQWHPSLERDLLMRANEAIAKAADSKDVRLSLFGLLTGRKS